MRESTFGAKDSAERNLLLIAVTEEPGAHYGHIATAFGVSAETIRLLRRLVERSGIAAVTTAATVVEESAQTSLEERLVTGSDNGGEAENTTSEQAPTEKEGASQTNRRTGRFASRSTPLRVRSCSMKGASRACGA